MVVPNTCTYVVVLCLAISASWRVFDPTTSAPSESNSGTTAPALSLIQRSKILSTKTLAWHGGSVTETKEQRKRNAEEKGEGKPDAEGDPDHDFTDLGTGSCQFPTGETPNHMHLGTHMKDRCAEYCLQKSSPDSFGKGMHCWGYTITKAGTCFIWRQGPLTNVLNTRDPSMHCFAVSAFLDPASGMIHPDLAPQPPPDAPPEPEPSPKPVIIPGVPHPELPPQPPPQAPEPETSAPPIIIPGVPHPLHPISRISTRKTHRLQSENTDFADFGVRE